MSGEFKASKWTCRWQTQKWRKNKVSGWRKEVSTEDGDRDFNLERQWDSRAFSDKGRHYFSLSCKQWMFWTFSCCHEPRFLQLLHMWKEDIFWTSYLRLFSIFLLFSETFGIINTIVSITAIDKWSLNLNTQTCWAATSTHPDTLIFWLLQS